jgi:hypothetical protein
MNDYIAVLHVNHYSDGNGDLGSFIQVIQQLTSKLGSQHLQLHMVVGGNTAPSQMQRLTSALSTLGTPAGKLHIHQVNEARNPGTNTASKSELNLVEFLCYLHDHPELLRAYQSAHLVATIATGFNLTARHRSDREFSSVELTKAQEMAQRLNLRLDIQTGRPADANEELGHIFSTLLPRHLPLIQINEHDNASHVASEMGPGFKAVGYSTGNRPPSVEGHCGLMVSDEAASPAKALMQLARDEPGYTAKLGLPASIHLTEESTLDFLERNALVPLYVGSDVAGSLGLAVQAILQSNVVNNKRIWLHTPANIVPQVQQVLSALAPRPPNQQVNVVTHWFTCETSFSLVFDVADVAVVTGDKTFELCIDHNTYPIFLAAPWKMMTWSSYGQVDGAPRFATMYHEASQWAQEAYEAAGWRSFDGASNGMEIPPYVLAVDRDKLVEFQTVVRPHYLERSFWHTFDCGVIPYVCAAWLDARLDTGLLHNRQLDWVRLIEVQTKLGAPTVLDDPRFLAWACMHLHGETVKAICERFPNHPHVARCLVKGQLQPPSTLAIQPSMRQMDATLVERTLGEARKRVVERPCANPDSTSSGLPCVREVNLRLSSLQPLPSKSGPPAPLKPSPASLRRRHSVGGPMPPAGPVRTPAGRLERSTSLKSTTKPGTVGIVRK